MYFNPRPPCGGRPGAKRSRRWKNTHFNPRPPCGGRHLRLTRPRERGNFNPRPPCGGRLSEKKFIETVLGISIHVPRVEDDVKRLMLRYDRRPFQSTSPVWRTTKQSYDRINLMTISIHVPRVEDDVKAVKRKRMKNISIHVPRVEDDNRNGKKWFYEFNFNPRPPCGGRLKERYVGWAKSLISIHVPRVEDDLKYFMDLGTAKEFQSTSPVWRTTKGMPIVRWADFQFQSTSPVWRTTGSQFKLYGVRAYFNPRPPCGGRRRMYPATRRKRIFQSTSPVWRTTNVVWSPVCAHLISIHVPRVEDDSGEGKRTPPSRRISIHVPRVEDDR